MFINILSVGDKGTWPTSFLADCGDRTRGNSHKLEHRKFCTNMQRNFFPVRVKEQWYRLPRKVVDSPSLKILQTQEMAQ